MKIGERVKLLRENANLTQIELAKILKISNSTLSQYENGVRIPSDDIKIEIASYFDVSIDYLMGRTDNEKNKSAPGEGGGQAGPPGYDSLNPANKAIVDRLIADLAENQSSP